MTECGGVVGGGEVVGWEGEGEGRSGVGGEGGTDLASVFRL